MGISPSAFWKEQDYDDNRIQKNLEADGCKTKCVNGEYFAYKDGKFYEFSIDWLGNKDFFEVSLDIGNRNTRKALCLKGEKNNGTENCLLL